MAKEYMNEVIFPTSIILPDRKTATRGAGKAGEIGLSGAQLVFFDGTNWKIVTAA